MGPALNPNIPANSEIKTIGAKKFIEYSTKSKILSKLIAAIIDIIPKKNVTI